VLLIPFNDLKALALFEQAVSIETSNFDPYATKAVFEKVFKPQVSINLIKETYMLIKGPIKVPVAGARRMKSYLRRP
jgi:hypothetical protein